MAKTTPLGVRVSAELKAALDAGAHRDVRSTASLVNKILTDWAVSERLLDRPPPAPAEPRPNPSPRPPSRPRSAPKIVAEPHRDRQISAILSGRERVTLDQLATAYIGVDLASAAAGTDDVPVNPHLGKALVASLTICGWQPSGEGLGGAQEWRPAR